MIQIYAPHNEREEEEKHYFYEVLQHTLAVCNRNDIVVVMDDFNAKVGGENEVYGSCMGRPRREPRTTTEKGYVIFLWPMA